MQYVRKGDVFNQDMSVKTMVYQASILFSSLYLYIYIYLTYVIYIYVSYIYISFTIIYRFFFFSFLFRKTTITKVRTLVLCFIGTYMYRRNLSIYLFIVLYIRSIALNYSLRLNRMRQK